GPFDGILRRGRRYGVRRHLADPPAVGLHRGRRRRCGGGRGAVLMALFRPQRAQTARNWGSVAELIARAGGRSTYAGVPVTEDSAMRHSAVWGCVDLLA